MKIAEDYAHELCCHLTKCGCGLSYSQERELKHAIKETMPIEQLDALKEGMQRVMKIVGQHNTTWDKDIRQAILELSEKDL
jgi:hypothetical protein